MLRKHRKFISIEFEVLILDRSFPQAARSFMKVLGISSIFLKNQKFSGVGNFQNYFEFQEFLEVFGYFKI
jgi:hypothetical protein